MSFLRRRPSSRDAILARLDQAVAEQRRISAAMDLAVTDQHKVNADLDEAVRELRSRAAKGTDDE